MNSTLDSLDEISAFKFAGSLFKVKNNWLERKEWRLWSSFINKNQKYQKVSTNALKNFLIN